MRIAIEETQRIIEEKFPIVEEYCIQLNSLKNQASSLMPTSRKIAECRKKILRQVYDKNARNLIIFLTSGIDEIWGGIMNVLWISEETKRLKHIHNAETIVCTVPGDPSLLKYTTFENKTCLLSFAQSLAYFSQLQNLILHVPDSIVHKFTSNISLKNRIKLSKLNVHINLMLQNIDFLPFAKDIERLRSIGRLTCTTAHQRYTTRALRNSLRCPVHKISAFVSPEQYLKKEYSEKENLMIVSPDPHPRKTEVLELIARRLPQLKIQIIKGIPYEEYKKTISRAKWALTFGEGLDGYFIETIFSGGIGFSVYNTKFFTEDFGCLRTVYDNYDVLVENICSDIKDLDNNQAYANYQKKQYALCSKHYDYREFVRNIESFYKGKYTYE